MNCVIIHSCSVRIRPTIPVSILLSIIANPLRTCFGPLDLLARGWFIRHQEERFSCWQLNGLRFVSVRSTAVVYFSVLVVHAVRKNATLVVFVEPVFIVPCYVTRFQSAGTWAFLVNTVFAFEKQTYPGKSYNSGKKKINRTLLWTICDNEAMEASSILLLR